MNQAMLSIIIPCKSAHNDPHIVKMVQETEKFCPNSEIIISSDRYGKGKGWALRQGVEHAKGDIICFIDGDLDISPGWIPELYHYIHRNDIVIGKKSITGIFSRRIITFCSRAFIGLLFGIWLDTQTGIKMFKRSSLPTWKENRFAYDIEILSKAKKAGAKIIEVPVEVNIRKKMPIKSILIFIKDSLKIKWSLLTARSV